MNDKVIKTAKKKPQRKEKAPLRDLFTMLVESDLHTKCVKEFRFHQTRMWRFDYAVPEYQIAIEVEGGVWTAGRHTRPQGFLGDMEKYNTATTMGWKVLRTTPDTLVSKNTINMLETIIKREEKEQKSSKND